MEPTGFLKLTREIRQQILSLSFDVDLDVEYAGVCHWAVQTCKATVWATTLRQVHSRVAEDAEWLTPKWRAKLKILSDRAVEKTHEITEPFAQLVAAWKLENSLLTSWTPPGVGRSRYRNDLRVRRNRVLQELGHNLNRLVDDFDGFADLKASLANKMNLAESTEVTRNARYEAEIIAFYTLWVDGVEEMKQEIKRAGMLILKVNTEVVEELGMDHIL